MNEFLKNNNMLNYNIPLTSSFKTAIKLATSHHGYHDIHVGTGLFSRLMRLEISMSSAFEDEMLYSTYK